MIHTPRIEMPLQALHKGRERVEGHGLGGKMWLIGGGPVVAWTLTHPGTSGMTTYQERTPPPPRCCSGSCPVADLLAVQVLSSCCTLEENHSCAFIRRGMMGVLCDRGPKHKGEIENFKLWRGEGNMKTSQAPQNSSIPSEVVPNTGQSSFPHSFTMDPRRMQKQ